MLILMSVLIWNKHYYVSVLGVVFIFYPKLWMRLGDILSFISTKVILSLIYSVFLLPFAVISRKKKLSDGWIINNKEYKEGDFIHPY